MGETPSVLIADDGQLDRAVRILEDLGVHPARVRTSELRGQPVEKPLDLLILAWHPTQEVPPLSDNPEGREPTKVCLHSQDFLPLRERLRQLGVDYLVQTSLDDDSLRRFLQTLLYRGPERRSGRRLPLGIRIGLRVAGKTERCRLLDLSRDHCRLELGHALELESELTALLPTRAGASSELELPGRVVRCEPREAGTAPPSWSVLVEFGDLDEQARDHVTRIVRGEQIGTRATPLQAEAAPVAEAPDAAERRGDDSRSAYDRQVVLLEVENAGGQGLGLGRDLSPSGVCVTGCEILPVGTKLTVALYGDPRAEPVVVDATVVRAGEEEMGLRMEGLDAAQQRAIEALQGTPSRIEHLQAGPGRRSATG